MSSSHEWEELEAAEYSARQGWMKRPSDIDKLAPALVKAWAKIDGAVKDSNNPHFRSKYADLSSVMAACKTALAENNLAVLQPLCKAPPGFIGVSTIIVHDSGQTLASEPVFIPFKDAQNPQAAGSAVTYARRYALSSMLGICPEDDDGNAATKAVKAAPVAPKEVDWETIIKKMTESFNAADKDRRKAIFLEARGQAIPEPLKTETLTYMSTTIKGMK